MDDMEWRKIPGIVTALQVHLSHDLNAAWWKTLLS